MIQLLLLILKIAGILLLAAAGLALTAILLVLFVPVRYRAEGSRYGAWCARGRVSWLFGALQLEASFENGEAEAALKILGRTVGGGSEDGEDLAEDLKDLETAELERPAIREERTSKPPRKPPDKPREKTGERIKTPEPPVHTASLRREEGKPGKAGGLLSRVRGRLRRTREGIRRLAARRDQVMDFLRDEANRRTFQLVKRQALRILRHIRPSRLEGRLRFGFDDPYRTGQALQAAALLMPLYRDRVQIIPAFEEEVLEGELKMSGRIRLAVLLAAGVRLWRDKNFRKLVGRLMDR